MKQVITDEALDSLLHRANVAADNPARWASFGLACYDYVPLLVREIRELRARLNGIDEPKAAEPPEEIERTDFWPDTLEEAAE